jgi:ribosomal protein L40E
MAKFDEAAERKFKNIFVCRRCKSKIRATNLKVIAGKVSCRKCGTKALKPKRKK